MMRREAGELQKAKERRKTGGDEGRRKLIKNQEGKDKSRLSWRVSTVGVDTTRRDLYSGCHAPWDTQT